MGTFPLNPPDKVEPSRPADEPTREDVNRNPEDLPARMRRTRRYFRLTRADSRQRYAAGLDSKPEDLV